MRNGGWDNWDGAMGYEIWGIGHGKLRMGYIHVNGDRGEGIILIGHSNRFVLPFSASKVTIIFI